MIALMIVIGIVAGYVVSETVGHFYRQVRANDIRKDVGLEPKPLRIRR